MTNANEISTPEYWYEVFKNRCPSLTLEELKSLWPVISTESVTEYDLSDLVDALRIGKQSANLDTDAKNVNNTTDQE